MFSVLWQFGWVGFGVSGGLLPELRLGVFSVTVCRGFFAAALGRAARAVREGLAHVG